MWGFRRNFVGNIHKKHQTVKDTLLARGWRSFAFNKFNRDDNKCRSDQNKRSRDLCSSNNIPEIRSIHRDILSNINAEYKNTIASMSAFVNTKISNVVAARTIPNQKEAKFAQTLEITLNKEVLLFLSSTKSTTAILPEQFYHVNEKLPD